MASSAGGFPTFFLSGFECSTFLWQDQGLLSRATVLDAGPFDEPVDLGDIVAAGVGTILATSDRILAIRLGRV